jgi:tRNA(fMet)-specific endonuclease VapC
VAVAEVTIAELLVGVLLADDAHRPVRQRFVDQLKEVVPIINYDSTVAASHARLLVSLRQKGRPRGAHDLIIAATASATEREVVSGDASAFEDLSGVILRRHRA